MRPDRSQSNHSKPPEVIADFRLGNADFSIRKLLARLPVSLASPGPQIANRQSAICNLQFLRFLTVQPNRA
jgi:hypothetical protein